MSALGLQVNDLNGFLDKVSKTSTSANTSTIELMEAFIVTGGKAKSLGADILEVSAVLGTMANRGLKGSEAGRGLSAILTNLTSPVGQAKSALEELNFSAFDAEGKFIGLEATFRKLIKSLEGMTQEQRVNYLAMIAGKEHGKTLEAILEGLSNEYDNLENSIVNSSGSLENMAKTMQNNASGGITGLKSKLESIGISVSKVLLPHIKNGIDVIGKLVDKFSNLSPKTQSTIVKFGLFAMVIPPLIIVGGALVRSISSISTAIGGLGKAFTFLSANPIVVVIGALVGVVLVVMHLWKTNEKFRDAIHNIWQGIVETVEWATNKIIDGINWVINKINAIPFVNIKAVGHVEWSEKSKQQKLDNFKSSGNGLQASKDGPLLTPGYNTPLINGSYRAGLDYVPYDGFVAELHRGERVLTAEENKLYSGLRTRDKSNDNDIVKMLNNNRSSNITNTNNAVSNNSSSNVTVNVSVNANGASNNNIDINNMADQVANIIVNKIRVAKINVI